MKKKILAGLIAATSCAGVHADTIMGIYVGAQAWQSELSGDAEGDAKGNSVLYAAFEHPIPMLPNAKLTNASIKQDIDPTGEIDLSFTDLTLYYEILDNWVSLDVGLNARMNDGEAGTEKIDSTLAMLYGKAQFELPIAGVGAGVELATGGSGDKATDINAYVMYEMSLGLGFQGGYHSIDSDYEIGSTDVSLKVAGPYASVYFHF